MSFDVSISHEQELITSRWDGPVDGAALYAYVDEVFARPEVRGYDELIDFSQVTDVTLPSETIGQLAAYSRQFDNPDRPACSAVVAGRSLVYGLSRMFTSLRALEPGDLREFRVFTSRDDAEDWLAAARRERVNS